MRSLRAGMPFGQGCILVGSLHAGMTFHADNKLWMPYCRRNPSIQWRQTEAYWQVQGKSVHRMVTEDWFGLGPVPHKP